MNFSKYLLLCVSLLSASASAANAQQNAQQPPGGPQAAEINAAATQPSYRRSFGVGYKIGNGLGFQGADVVIGLTDQFSLGLQANNFSSTDSAGSKISGYGVAPFAEYRLNVSGSTPYLSAGLLYATLTLDDVRASASGGFANIGWQWRWQFGLAVHVGAGVGYLGSVKATDGINSIERSGGAHFNIESGLRYFFF